MKKIFKSSLFLVATTALLFSACSKDEENPNPTPNNEVGAVEIKFDHGWGPAHLPFALNAPLVHPMTQEDINFSLLRYYFTNVELHRPDGSVWKQPESYHLVTFSNTAQPVLELKDVPAGRYTKITFMIGVDSLRNVSGAQEGALSPSENMFWSWTTGYIFVKAEGTSTASPTGSFVYHLGGFSGANNAIQTKTLDFAGAHIDVAPNAKPSIHLKVNAARFWHGGISLGTVNMIHMPGANAKLLSENFIGAFSFDHIH